MEFLLLDAPYEDDLCLTHETFEELKQYKTIALYGAVQFIPFMQDIHKHLEAQGHEVITSQPSRTNVAYQILGCDCYWQNLKLEKDPDVFLYIGDGLFHPKALALAQKDRETFIPIACYDPKRKVISYRTQEEIARLLKKNKGSLLKFLSSDCIGVLVTSKPGQKQFNAATKLLELYTEKQFYFFIENTFEFGRLEDYPFIECWVNTACPRIGFDDGENLEKSMINLNDALHIQERL
jgi:2-(3-amino-3-carboxypropyl)histidine synthase